MPLFVFHVHKHYEIPPWLEPALTDIREKLALLLAKEDHMTKELDTLTADVAENTDVVESAIALIGNIKAQLDAAGTDPVALAALSSTLETEDAKLAALVAANTPAAPPVTDPGTTEPPTTA